MLPQIDTSAKENAPRLLVDAMLGRLARWLRLMGYDTLYWRDGSDAALARQARREGRVVLTRDRQLAGRRGLAALLIESEQLDAQIAQVRAALGDDPGAFRRCSACNGPLLDLPREEAQALVPPYVWSTQPVFRRCGGCGRVYWRGTHWPGMQARLGTDEAC